MRAWLITGAASGIGKELSSQLARRGEPLVLWDRDGEALARTVALLGPAVLHHEQVDVTSHEATRDAAQRAGNVGLALGRVVHCAGILRVGAALSMAPDDYRAMLEVNALGSMHVARALLPSLIQSGRTHGRTLFAFVASVAGLRGVPTLAGYSASKFAVVGFAQALRDELASEPVDIRVVCPPAVATPMLQRLGELPPVYRLSPPQPVEKVAAALLASLEKRGLIALLDAPSKLMWGVQRALPSGLDWLLARANKR